MNKSIVLGMFDVRDFVETEKKYNASQYPFRNIISYELWYEAVSIIETVSLALSRCDKCYFILTGIEFPLNPEESYTCKELKFILNHPILLDKVIFVLDGKELSEEEALTYLRREDLIQSTKRKS